MLVGEGRASATRNKEAPVTVAWFSSSYSLGVIIKLGPASLPLDGAFCCERRTFRSSDYYLPSFRQRPLPTHQSPHRAHMSLNSIEFHGCHSPSGLHGLSDRD